ncbi:MAG: hypothetical protein WAX69_13840 [Victivallales bacterium]
MLSHRIDCDSNEIIIFHREGPPQITFRGGALLPAVSGSELVLANLRLAKDIGDGTTVIPLIPSEAIAGGEMKIERRMGHVVLRTSYRAAKPHRLSEWTIAPKGSRISWNYLASFRNRHHHLHPYRQISLRGYDDGYFGAPGNINIQSTGYSYKGTSTISENTYSQDWQFAPHPSLMIFQAPRCNLIAGCLDLPKSGFGIYFDCFQYEIGRWSIDLGGETHGMEVKAGDEVSSPAFIFALDHSEDVYHTARLYHDILESRRFIPARDELPDDRSWHMPFTCTWFDQQSGQNVQYHESGKKLLKANEALCSKLLDAEIEFLRQAGTPWGTFCIDDGWQITRGDWEMDPVRMAGARSRIDALHAMGLKVILWWAPFDILPNARIRERRDLLCGGGKLGRHGMPLLDYSNPHVQESYLKPLARLLFSDEPGCYNADGVKTDFMADKIHPDMPVHNPEWRGEERFIFNTLRAMRDEGRKYKPAWTHQGCTAHPHFEQLNAFTRCYDNGSSDYRIMFERARMVAAFQPHNPVNTTVDCDGIDTDAVLDEAMRTGQPIETGGVLGWGSRRFTQSEIALFDRHVRLFVERWTGDIR